VFSASCCYAYHCPHWQTSTYRRKDLSTLEQIPSATAINSRNHHCRDAKNSPEQLAADDAASIQCYQEIAVQPAYQGMNEELLSAIASRMVKLQRFKQENWGHRLGTYYLERKSQLDRAIYSLMRIADGTIAQEVYFRVKGGEKTFSELAWKYSQGKEARDGGKIGPMTIEGIEPEIAQQLLRLQPGEISSLFIYQNTYAFVRLEELIHAQFDEPMRKLLLDELFEKWLKEEIATEIGLVSLQPKIINPDFMSHDHYSSVVIPTLDINRSIELSTAPSNSVELSHLPQPSSKSVATLEEDVSAERGDTGLLLSQLQSVAQHGAYPAATSTVTRQSEDRRSEEDFSSDRGDTGLLLSQLQAVAQGEAPPAVAQETQERHPPDRRLQPLSAIQPPSPPQPPIEEQFTLERGDTNLLLSQLQSVAQGEPAPTDNTPVRGKFNLGDLEMQTIASPLATIADRVGPSDFFTAIPTEEPKNHKLLIAFLIVTVILASGIGSFYVVRSMGITPIIRMMEKK
jgi:hypothetical protein